MLCQADAARTELVRLASFSKWPVEPAMKAVSFVCLAAAGFSYTGNSDGIVCSHCNTVVRGWLGTHYSPHLEHRCPSKPATHHADSAEHTADISTTESYETTAGNCRRTVPEPETDVTSRSCDKSSRGLDAIHRDNEKLTQKLKVSRTPTAAASSFSPQMALMGADDNNEPTSGDVRDAAGAELSKSMVFFKF